MAPCPGIEFSPRDDQLLTFYLPKKIAGGGDALAIPNYLICDFNVYLTEPWNLPRDTFQYQNNKKDMHFFSRRQPTSANSKRVQRTAGHGFWYGARGDEKVYYQSQHVGYKTVLTFKYTKGGKEINTNWIMHEFHLKPPENSNKFESMVLCRIHMNKTKKDSEWDFGSAAIGKEEGTTSAATDVEERPLKRKRVVVNSELHPQLSSSLPSSLSSFPNTLAFVPCQEQEALKNLISTLDENMVNGNEQEAEKDEGQVIAMLLKEHNSMTNHSTAAAESLRELEAPAATYERERLRKRKCVEGLSSSTNYCDTETHTMVEIEASQPSSSSPYLSSSWVSTPALDSFEESQVHSQFTSGVHSFSAAVSEQLKGMGMIMAQDDWKWDDLDIDFGSNMSSLDELMKSFHDS